MIQPKCPICGLILEAGAQEVTKEDLEFVLIGISKLRTDFGFDYSPEDKQKAERAEYLRSVNAKEQVKYWAHDPKSIHYDIEFFAHRICFDKVKQMYPDFDKPTQADWEDYKLPVINKTGAVELKKVSDFNKLKIL